MSNKSIVVRIDLQQDFTVSKQMQKSLEKIFMAI